MQYNLAKHTSTQANTTVGNIPLTTHEVVSLAELSFASNPLATVSGGEILCVDCDLGTRVHLNSVDYYFATDQDTDAVASGIELGYKNETFESYTTTTFTYNGDNRYIAGFPSSPFAPRYLRLTHTISGTTVTGTIEGFAVLNDDTTIDFGTDGSLGSFNVTSSLISEDIVSTIPIYNDGNTIADAYVNLEPQSTDVDLLISLSNSESGPWTGVRTGRAVFGADRWSYVTRENTDITHVDGQLRLTGVTLGDYNYTTYEIETATITSPPFYKYPAKYTTIAFDIDVGTGKVTPDSEEEDTVIEVRHNNSEPLSYLFIRRMMGEETDRLFYKDYWLHDYSEKYEYVGNYKSGGYVDRDPLYQITMDKFTDRWAYIARYRQHTSYWRYYWYVTTQDGETGTKYEKELYGTAGYGAVDSATVFERIHLDKFGGVWIYFYMATGSSSTWINTAGYHLGYFHRGMSEGFHISNDRKVISDCDVVYETGDLWYADTSLRQVIKIDYDGVVKAQYAADDDEVDAVAALPDGGCWFSMAGDLYRLDNLGNLTDTIASPGTTANIHRIALDVDDDNYLWLSDGDYIVRYDMVSDVHDLRVDVESPRALQPLRSGILCYCSDDHNRYVSKANKRVEGDYYYGANMMVGALEAKHDEDGHYTTEFPIAIDNTWNNLEWKTVDPRTYMLPDYKYHQFRTVMNAGTPYSTWGTDGDDTWNPDDDFEQSRTVPFDSRWTYTDNVSVVSGTLLLEAKDASSTPLVTSSKRWCVNKSSCDLFISYEFESGVWPTNQYIYLMAYGIDPVDHTYNGTYFYTNLHHSSNTRVYNYVYSKNGVDYNSNTYTYTDTNFTQASGILRMRTSGDTVYSNHYDPQWNDYTGQIGLGGINNMLSSYFYVRIYTTAGAGFDNVKIKRAQLSGGTAYITKNSPVLGGLHLQDATIVNDIYPQQYKNLYMRTSMENAQNDSNGLYDSNINVWWDVPI